MKKRLSHNLWFKRSLRGVLVLLVVLVAAAGLGQAAASPAPQAAPSASPLHPTFPLLDANGENVLTSGEPVSTMHTCGGDCHNTTFIEQHSFHADLGLADFGAEDLQLAQPWDQSRGVFGKWDPLIVPLSVVQPTPSGST